MYALIQTGHCIYGVGDTIDAARADAVRWLDDDTDVAAIPAFRDPYAMRRQTVHGDLAIVPCSAALAAYVREYGTTTYKDSGDELRLPSEHNAS